MEWTSVVAVASVGGAVAFFGRLAYDGVRRRNGVGGNLKAHDDSSSAHPDMREDISNMSEKLDGIDKTGNRILANLEARPCLKDCEKRDDN